MPHTKHDLRPRFAAIQQLAGAAERGEPLDGPVQPLLYAFPDETHGALTRSILRPRLDTATGLVAFDLIGPGDIGERTRLTLPVYFAIMCVLEMVPGLRMVLAEGGGLSGERERGTVRGDDERIFVPKLFLKAHPRAGVRPATTALSRILLGAPFFANLYEKLGTDHHVIVPANFALGKRRISTSRTRSGIVEAALAISAVMPPGALPYVPQELADAFARLFSAADRMHGADLAGWEPRYAYDYESDDDVSPDSATT